MQQSETQYPAIIGITGKKYSGKDTLGKLFMSKYNYKRLAYADPLKTVCKCIFGFNDDQLYGDKKEIDDEFWKTTPRKVLQYVGTNMFREHMKNIIPHIENNIWVEVVKKQILDERKQNPNATFVITDIRFENEAQLIRDLGGIVIKLKRNDSEIIIDNHASEQEIDMLYADYEFTNNNTIEELYEKVLDAISVL